LSNLSNWEQVRISPSLFVGLILEEVCKKIGRPKVFRVVKNIFSFLGGKGERWENRLDPQRNSSGVKNEQS
jgi:hypothetical protein